MPGTTHLAQRCFRTVTFLYPGPDCGLMLWDPRPPPDRTGLGAPELRSSPNKNYRASNYSHHIKIYENTEIQSHLLFFVWFVDGKANLLSIWVDFWRKHTVKTRRIWVGSLEAQIWGSNLGFAFYVGWKKSTFLKIIRCCCSFLDYDCGSGVMNMFLLTMGSR